MKTISILTSLAILMLSSNSLFAQGITLPEKFSTVESGTSREPQKIYFFDNPNDPSKIIYYFCHSTRRKNCIALGNPEGISKTHLLAESEKFEKFGPYLKYFTPVAEITATLLLFYLVLESGGTIAFVSGAGVVTAFDHIHTKIDYESHREMADVFDPKREDNKENYFVLSNLSIVNFSYFIEDKIKKLTSFCYNNPNDTNCLFKKMSTSLRAL